jgi:5-carboxymethyl-2-hydroxymuconate isomerase
VSRQTRLGPLWFDKEYKKKRLTPHIVVELSRSLCDEIDVPGLLKDMHASLSAQEGVTDARIKTRAIPLDYQVIGINGPEGQMIHITLLLLEGRDLASKKRYSLPLHEIAKKAAPEGIALTLEVRDMTRDSYIM